jgi:glycosyltransferase involved in cell wall biosynthesis
MKVLQINTTANSASHGRIAEGIGVTLLEKGHESYIAYGRSENPSRSNLIKIGNRYDQGLHLLKTRLLDMHGFGSRKATGSFIDSIKNIDPDIIHLHNLHGYYINLEILFEYLKEYQKPVIWTLHDCWAFTGHCCFFDAVDCRKWQKECFRCPRKNAYPKSWIADNSRRNFHRKKDLFCGIKRMVLVPPSEWLADHLRNSFLNRYEIKVINNGVETGKFIPTINDEVSERYGIKDKYILGVASIWSKRKGLADFIKLKELLGSEVQIVLVGVSPKQIRSLPSTFKCIPKTENIKDLAAIYSGARVFVNPTYIDNFPLVNIEALACGTPVVTYNTGGSPESIGPGTGLAVERGNVRELAKAITTIMNSEGIYRTEKCRDHALENFSANARYGDYINLYKTLL